MVDVPPVDEEDAEATPATKGPVEVNADDLADEEWGPVKEKGKKSKKDKKKKGQEKEENGDEAVDTPTGKISRRLTLSVQLTQQGQNLNP